MRATTRRSNQIANSVVTTRKTKIASALTSTSHQGSWLKSASGSSAASTVQLLTPSTPPRLQA